jgi:exodeoxyribonuclease V alpha subunit
LRRYWRYEQEVIAALRERRARPIPEAPEWEATLRVRLDELFPPGGSVQGEPDWQKVACAVAACRNFTVITGGPGTGKTTTVIKLLALLQGLALAEARTLRIHLAAPTGKAAARIGESISRALAQLPERLRDGVPKEAVTLHRLLGSRPGSRHFRHHAANPLHADVVVVDEASMIDLEMMAVLLAALRAETRLILLGDKDQLASVEAGSVLGDLCRGASGHKDDTGPGGFVEKLARITGVDQDQLAAQADLLANHTVMLTVSHRFGGESGIGRLARAVHGGLIEEAREILRNGGRRRDVAVIPLRGTEDDLLERLAVGGDGIFPGRPEPALGYRHYLELLRRTRPSQAADLEEFAGWARAVLTAFQQFQLLCALRTGPWGVAGLNARIASVLRREGWIEREEGWYEGRPVLVTHNDYDLDLMNGDIGIALRWPAPFERETGADLHHPRNDRIQRLRVAFLLPNGVLKTVLPSRLTAIETVYAMTVHKSQGSEFNHVALVLPDAPNPILTRELVYTGITRARRWFGLLLPDPEVFDRAVATRVRRASGLAEFTAGPGTGDGLGSPAGGQTRDGWQQQNPGSLG